MPTYRLIIGIPGKSNAFAISKKLGLSDDIIERAKTNIDSNKVDFETLLSDLENSRKEIERDKAEIALKCQYLSRPALRVRSRL